MTPGSVRRGHPVRVHGVVPGCQAAVTLISRAFSHEHDFAGLPALFAHVRMSGRYSVRIRIPAGRAPGRYSITGRCGGGNLGVSAKLSVLS